MAQRNENAEHWGEPTDLAHAKSVGAHLTRMSWHIRRIPDGAKWAARNEKGEVKTGTTPSVEQARIDARDHAYS